MKKMCKYATQDCMGLKYKYMFKSCPKNSNHRCEIVQPKKRTRTVKVWALKGNPRYCAPVKWENFCVPATLTYEVEEEGK